MNWNTPIRGRGFTVRNVEPLFHRVSKSISDGRLPVCKCEEHWNAALNSRPITASKHTSSRASHSPAKMTTVCPHRITLLGLQYWRLGSSDVHPSAPVDMHTVVQQTLLWHIIDIYKKWTNRNSSNCIGRLSLNGSCTFSVNEKNAKMHAHYRDNTTLTATFCSSPLFLNTFYYSLISNTRAPISSTLHAYLAVLTILAAFCQAAPISFFNIKLFFHCTAISQPQYYSDHAIQVFARS